MLQRLHYLVMGLSRANAVRRHLKLEGLRCGSVMFVSLGELHGCASRPCLSVAALATHAYPSRAKHKTGCFTAGGGLLSRSCAMPIAEAFSRRSSSPRRPPGAPLVSTCARKALRRRLAARGDDLARCRSPRRPGEGLAGLDAMAGAGGPAISAKAKIGDPILSAWPCRAGAELQSHVL